MLCLHLLHDALVGVDVDGLQLPLLPHGSALGAEDVPPVAELTLVDRSSHCDAEHATSHPDDFEPLRDLHFQLGCRGR